MYDIDEIDDNVPADHDLRDRLIQATDLLLHHDEGKATYDEVTMAPTGWNGYRYVKCTIHECKILHRLMGGTPPREPIQDRRNDSDSGSDSDDEDDDDNRHGEGEPDHPGSERDQPRHREGAPDNDPDGDGSSSSSNSVHSPRSDQGSDAGTTTTLAVESVSSRHETESGVGSSNSRTAMVPFIHSVHPEDVVDTLTVCTDEDKMITVMRGLEAHASSLHTMKLRRMELTNVQRGALALARMDDPITYASMKTKIIDSESHNVITNCSSLIKALDVTEAGIYRSIKLLLESVYQTFIENTKATSTYGQIKLADFKLPPSILGKEDPLKAAELITVLRLVIHGHPAQSWAIIPVLERLFSWKPGQTRWVPTRMKDIEDEDSMLRDYPSLRPFYINQSKEMYELIFKKSRDMVARSLDMLKTQQVDTQVTHETMSEKNDGPTTIAWWLHYHTAHDMDLDDEYVDSFNYMWAWFKSMNLPKVTERVRKELPRARRMNLQLKYSRTIAKWANEVLGRGPRFHGPMTTWLTCPDRKNLTDALCYVSQFLGDVDCIYASSNSTAITSSTSRHS